jgi:hypothetical protein
VRRLEVVFGDDLDFLAEIDDVEWLHVNNLGLRQCDGIQQLRRVHTLELGAYCTSRLDFAALPALRRLYTERVPGWETAAHCVALEHFHMQRYPETDLARLASLTNLRSLRLGDSRTLRSLDGIESMQRLERLSLGALAVRDISALRPLSSTLTHLEIDGCRGITEIGPIGALVNLRSLAVTDCGDIDSLTPIRSLVKLDAVWLWGSTRIRDGDLSVLKELPLLTQTSFMDRRGYSHTLAEVEAALRR